MGGENLGHNKDGEREVRERKGPWLGGVRHFGSTHSEVQTSMPEKGDLNTG